MILDTPRGPGYKMAFMVLPRTTLHRFFSLTGVLLLSTLFVVGSGVLPLILHIEADHCCHCGHDHDKDKKDSRDCPECQALLSLATLNPGLFDGSAFLLLDSERAAEFDTERPFNTHAAPLPAIRAPPAIPA